MELRTRTDPVGGLKTYEVWDQRFPNKDPKTKTWSANLVPVGTIQARDLDHALRVAKSKARFPVVFNPEDFRAALYQDKQEKSRELAELLAAA